MTLWVFSREGQRRHLITKKRPLIRTVGRVIYFDGVKGKVLNSVKHSLVAPLKFHPEQARPHGEKEEY